MKLEAFNLEKARNGAKVVTSEGREITQLHFFTNVITPYPVYGCLQNRIARWTIDGFFLDSNSKHYNDLFIEIEIKSIWQNVYRDMGDVYTSGVYKTKEDALNEIIEGWEYIKTIEITDQP